MKLGIKIFLHKELFCQSQNLRIDCNFYSKFIKDFFRDPIFEKLVKFNPLARPYCNDRKTGMENLLFLRGKTLTSLRNFTQRRPKKSRNVGFLERWIKRLNL
jgi:hypothetical protein